MLKHYTKFEALFAQYLSRFEFLKPHFDDPVSQTMTTVFFIILILIIIYKIIFQIGVYFGYWDIPGKEYFVDRPVHCAHVYVHGYIHDKEGLHDSTKLNYHIEFSPEEYHKDDPELGSSLGFLRKKLYFLFKDSTIFEDLNLKSPFRISDVDVFDANGKKILDDSKPLCLVGIETGNRITAHFNIDK